MSIAMTPELASLVDRVRAAGAAGTPLRLRGAGTKDFYGQALSGEVLDTRGYSGIVSYEPSELVVTARCGTPVKELEAALAENGQMLAFEPPVFGGRATVGGMFAAGLSGPRRASAGAVRDFTLGAVMVDAAGDVNAFGGQVMKNVAGYDISRVLCGSLGILGLVAQVSFKVLPRPASSATVSMTMGEGDALRLLNVVAGQPLPLSASAWHGNGLRLRLSGARAAVGAAVTRFTRDNGAIVLEPSVANAYWAGIREQTDAFFSGPEPLWRLSLPSTARPLAMPGHRLIEWGGSLRWLRTIAPADAVRQAAIEAGGSATLYRGGDRKGGVFHPLAPAMMELHRRLKRQFDPRGIFNPGRMYPEL